MKQATIQLETLVCPSCTMKIEAALKSFVGIKQDSVKVSFNTSRVRFNFDESQVVMEDVEKTINKVGFDVIKVRVK